MQVNNVDKEIFLTSWIDSSLNFAIVSEQKIVKYFWVDNSTTIFFVLTITDLRLSIVGEMDQPDIIPMVGSLYTMVDVMDTLVTRDTKDTMDNGDQSQ